MTNEEANAVLSLWKDVPETRLEGVEESRMGIILIGTGVPSGLNEYASADLISGHLRRWLETRCSSVEIHTSHKSPRCSILFMRAVPGAGYMATYDSSILLALIDAVRVVVANDG